jgi:hypothetical protein
MKSPRLHTLKLTDWERQIFDYCERENVIPYVAYGLLGFKGKGGSGLTDKFRDYRLAQQQMAQSHAPISSKRAHGRTILRGGGQLGL